MAQVKKLKSWVDAVASQLCFEPEIAQAYPELVYGMEQDWLPWGEEIEVERIEGVTTIFDLWETAEELVVPEWLFEDYVLPSEEEE